MYLFHWCSRAGRALREADETLEADLVVCTAGQSPVSGPLVDAFLKTGTGAVRIERSLQVLGQPRVFAVGDVVLGEGEGAGGEAAKPLPATAQVAFQQSDFAAWNIWASINGKPTRPFEPAAAPMLKSPSTASFAHLRFLLSSDTSPPGA